MPPTISPPRTPWHSLPKDTNSHNRVIKFTNARVFLKGKFRREDLWVRDGRVIDPASRFWEAATFSEYACDLIVDCEGHILCPGFIDIQCNGELAPFSLGLVSLMLLPGIPFPLDFRAVLPGRKYKATSIGRLFSHPPLPPLKTPFPHSQAPLAWTTRTPS